MSSQRKLPLIDFVQLDGWHEHSHPSYWSTKFSIEAELHDAFAPDASVYTERIASNGAKDDVDAVQMTSFDLTSVVSYMRLDATEQLNYSFAPRPIDPLTGLERAHRRYTVSIVARSASTQEDGGCIGAQLHVHVDHLLTHRQEVQDLGTACITERGWQTLVIAPPAEVPTGRTHTLAISVDRPIELDRLHLQQE